MVDWDKDGLMDLVMFDHEGYLAFYERFLKNGELLLRPGKRIFAGEDLSGKTKLLRLNEMEAGHNGPENFAWLTGTMMVMWIYWRTVKMPPGMKNIREKDGQVFFINRGNLMMIKLTGHDIKDWNHDGVPELLLGAEDGHFYYLPRK